VRHNTASIRQSAGAFTNLVVLNHTGLKVRVSAVARDDLNILRKLGDMRSHE